MVQIGSMPALQRLGRMRTQISEDTRIIKVRRSQAHLF